MSLAEQATPSVLARIDKVWAASGILLLGVLAFVLSQFGETLIFLGESWLWTAPFILFSCALSASIAATALDKPFAEVLRRRATIAVLLAGVSSALSPFSSVSVIPLVAGLLGAGAPLAPVMAFWVGSPLIDPEMFLLTFGIIDLPFALTRAMTAVLSGLMAALALFV